MTRRWMLHPWWAIWYENQAVRLNTMTTYSVVIDNSNSVEMTLVHPIHINFLEIYWISRVNSPEWCLLAWKIVCACTALDRTDTKAKIDVAIFNIFGGSGCDQSVYLRKTPLSVYIHAKEIYESEYQRADDSPGYWWYQFLACFRLKRKRRLSELYPRHHARQSILLP